jgi:IS30 family transposase
MDQHAQFTLDTGVQVYFCDTKGPWQRGSNENTSDYSANTFPKAHMSELTQTDLDFAAHQLNGRPRRILGWKTPPNNWPKRCHEHPD